MDPLSAVGQGIRFGAGQSRGPAPILRLVDAALADPIAAALVVAARPADLIRDRLGLDRRDLVIVAPELVAEDARVVAALARLASTIVLPPTAPPTLIAAAQGARVAVAQAPDSQALIAAAAAAMKSCACDH